MSSLRHSRTDFLTQWMPSSTRAGVILSRCQPNVPGPIRIISSEGTLRELEDCESSCGFTPLHASGDSSCVSVDHLCETPGIERTVGARPIETLSSGPKTKHSNGFVASLEDMDEPSDLPVIMKLDQLKKWQQQMQEQLKAQQLEELLRLQKEQQRLLGIMNVSVDCTADSTEELVSSEKKTLKHHIVSNNRQTSTSPSIFCKEPNSGSPPQDLQQTNSIRHRWRENQMEEVISISSDDSLEQSSSGTENKSTVVENKSVTLTNQSNKRQDSISEDRPIKPIQSQKKTFEEMLEEELRLEEQRLKTKPIHQIRDGGEATLAQPKRTFLKRGEGLSRFYRKTKANGSKSIAQKDRNAPIQFQIISRSQSEPLAIQRCRGQQTPLQRSSSIVNKVNQRQASSSPPQGSRVENKAVRNNILANRQSQSKETNRTVPDKHQESQQKEQTGRQTVGRSVHNTHPNPVTKHAVMCEGVRTARNEEAEIKHGSMAEILEKRSVPVGGEDNIQQESFEMSFQEKMQNWECDNRLENMELGEFELLEQAAEELSFSSNSSFVMKIMQMDQQQRNCIPDRRLSSTPIKSSPKVEVRRRNSCGNFEAAPSSTSSNGCKVLQEDTVTSEDVGKQAAAVEDDCPSFSCGSSISEIQDSRKPFPCFTASSEQHYNKKTYEDEESSRDSASDVTDGENIEEAVDDITVMEDNEDEQEKVVFDDDDTWNDIEETTLCNSDILEVTIASKDVPVGNLEHKTKVQRKVCKVVEFDGCMTRKDPDPPPASQLMTKLFPALRPKTETVALATPPKPEETNQQVQSKQLRERLVELELEIERFKKENATLGRLRLENVKLQETLRKEQLEFEKTKAEQLAKFEKSKEEESRKLQKERKLFEKHVSAARAIPDKKEREEIQSLKQQLTALQEELRKKESRWSSTHNRLRQQIDSLNLENSSLKDEVQMLEKLRLSAFKKNSIDAEKDVSAAKGVKFASPLDSRAGCSSPPEGGATVMSRSSHKQSSQTTTGIKSSLRRPSLASAVVVSRRSEEKSNPAMKSSDKPTADLTSSCAKKSETSGVESEPRSELDPQEVILHPDGKTEKLLPGGEHLIVFPNGTKKEVSADGLTIKVTFFNGDTKQITADQKVIYYYAEAQTTHVTYVDGTEVLHFPNNQTEKHFPDGRKIITFSDQTVKNLFPDGREKSVLTDGTVINVSQDGTKEIHFNTGQKEIHTAEYKRREYPDGTVKTVYSDGRQDTRYPNGRLRVKDKDGNIVLDIQQ